MKALLLLATLTLGIAIGAAAQAPAAQAPDGQALYRDNCRVCHGTDGVPPQRMMTLYKNLRALDSAYLAGRSEDSLVIMIRDGVGTMKPYKDRLTQEQTVAIAKYVKTLASAAWKEP